MLLDNDNDTNADEDDKVLYNVVLADDSILQQKNYKKLDVFNREEDINNFVGHIYNNQYYIGEDDAEKTSNEDLDENGSVDSNNEANSKNDYPKTPSSKSSKGEDDNVGCRLNDNSDDEYSDNVKFSDESSEDEDQHYIKNKGGSKKNKNRHLSYLLECVNEKKQALLQKNKKNDSSNKMRLDGEVKKEFIMMVSPQELSQVQAQPKPTSSFDVNNAMSIEYF